ncbi:membrane protein insertase YidC [Rickettsiales bacterium]|nr:membrane protein insertase YidC [Rickettsiales bacterium]
MPYNKNLITAVVLSIIVLVTWQYFYVNPRVEEAQRIARLKQIAQQNEAKYSKNNQIPTESSDNSENLIDDNRTLTREEAVKSPGRIKIRSDRLHGSISLTGARIDDITLAEYKTSLEKDANEVVLLSPSKTKQVYFAEFGWISPNSNTPMPNADTVWYTEQTTLTPNNQVTLKWDNNDGLKFYITISMDDQYMFKIKRGVVNYGNRNVKISSYGLINRARNIDKHSYFILHEGALGVLDGILHEERFDDLIETKKVSFKDSKGWIGLTDKYWLTSLIPDQSDSFDTNFKYYNRKNQNRYQVDYLGQSVDLAPNSDVSTTDHLFAGAKKVGLLDKYGKDLNIELFDRAVDFGWLYFITKPIFKLLTYYNSLLANFGLAILLLTVTLKILLFPLANKSYISMHKMKKLQPKLMEIKEKYTNDKAQMNKEVMELYKRESVNPLAGCLPILLQIPVFFALYKVLFVTIEMRHAPFFGWIKDLSAPDPTSIFNLFGLLPFDPPSFLIVGVWPILMGITMYLQQKMNPAPTDPTQAMVMKALPFVFVFLFASFPAGLVIYWAWNNTLSILQQWVITRNIPEKHK